MFHLGNLQRLFDYQNYLDTSAETAKTIKANISLCEATYSSEHAYGFSNFGTAPVHKFCNHSEKTSFNGLVTFKCYTATYGNLCEVAINQDWYPTVGNADSIFVEIGEIRSELTLYSELDLSTEGENHIVRRYWLEGTSSELFNFIKSNIGSSYDISINWN